MTDLGLGSIGPISRGPLAIGQREDREPLKVVLPHARDEDDDEQEKEDELKADRKLPFNPHTDALRTAQFLEHNRRVVALLEPSSTVPLLGSHVNVLA